MSSLFDRLIGRPLGPQETEAPTPPIRPRPIPAPVATQPDPPLDDPFRDDAPMSEEMAGVPPRFRSAATVDTAPVAAQVAKVVADKTDLPSIIYCLPICACMCAVVLKEGGESAIYPLDEYIGRIQQTSLDVSASSYLEDLINMKIEKGTLGLGWYYIDMDGKPHQRLLKETEDALMAMVDCEYKLQKELRKPKPKAPAPVATAAAVTSGGDDIVAELKEALEGLPAKDRMPIILSFVTEELDPKSYRAILRQLLPEEKVAFSQAYLKQNGVSS